MVAVTMEAAGMVADITTTITTLIGTPMGADTTTTITTLIGTPMGAAPSTMAVATKAIPCLGSVNVTPWRTRLDFPDCHYITVSSPSGGVGGFKSVNFNAFRTRRASGQPPLTPRRSGRSSMRNVTKRTV